MKRILKFIFVILVVVGIGGLSFGFYFLNTKVDSLTKGGEKNLFLENRAVDGFVDTIPPETTDCDATCRKVIAEEVSRAVATLSSSKVNTVIREVAAPSSSVNTTYIGLGTTFTTTSTDWVDVPDSSVYVNLEKDYGKGGTVSWEAQLKVAHGNGKAYARLYDDTNKIAVDFSELSTENNVSYKQVSSGNLPFWKGRNLYKVQVKSLNSFEVTYSGGRIKVSY